MNLQQPQWLQDYRTIESQATAQHWSWEQQQQAIETLIAKLVQNERRRTVDVLKSYAAVTTLKETEPVIYQNLLADMYHRE